MGLLVATAVRKRGGQYVYTIVMMFRMDDNLDLLQKVQFGKLSMTSLTPVLGCWSYFQTWRGILFEIQQTS